MNTSSSFKVFASPPLIFSSRPPKNASQNPRFSFKLPRFCPKTIRCMRDSLNLRSSPNAPSALSFATVEAPLGTETSDKLRILVSEFRSLTEPIDRVKRLLNYAADLAPLDDTARVSANRVTGCTTQVWLEIKMDEFGRMRFKADSDSEISKGFCSCLIWILDGAKPEEVMGVRSEDLSEMNVGVHGKEQSRVNTWQNVLMSMQKRTMTLVDADVAHRGGERPPHHHKHDLLFKYVNGSYMESSKVHHDYSISLLPLYYDFTI
ncbi:PREDICTED: sufE-like protein 2, chloroplastic [Camelina sativa]|uniref:SufE-like protein 2, chloroplastic n=1 Tax=Camelina sativa TaxID=90675 RepID=A0ABM0WGD1_CAMSA|nr:PREDICTED: sufE-like protein 2, chloroplastic [Camelina sativa]